MAFPPQFLDDLRARVPLAEVVGRRVRLVRRGREFVGLCPFHNEKTPSFTVVEDKGFFHCFGCGAHGDVIGFVMRAESLGFLEAVERLAQEAGLPMPARGPRDHERAEEQRSLYAVLEAAAARFERTLGAPGGASARDYLARRGVDEATIAVFRLGFAPDERRALKQALAEEGISEEMMVGSGLVVTPEDGSSSYDRFRGRVIFPIMDRQGRVVAFGGRALGPNGPKYLNSPETPFFHKGALLYGYSLAAPTARRKQTVVVVEGYMDVIAFHRVGIQNAVAPLGTALTEHQIEELWRLAPEPVVCFDGDRAGMAAAYRAAERALPRLRPGKSLRFAFLPEDEDPDSLIAQRGAESMRAILARARPLADVLWQWVARETGLETPERRAAALARMTSLTERIPNKDIRYQYRDEARKRMWEQGRSGRGTGRARSPAARGLSSEDFLRRVHGEAATDRERTILQTFLNFPMLLDEFSEEFSRFEIANPRRAALRDAMLAAAGEPWESARAFQRHLAERSETEGLDPLVGGDARYLDWAAREEEASLDDARTQLRHIFDLHYRLVGFESTKRAAEEAFAADPSEANSDRLVEAIRAVQRAPGLEAEIPDYGLASGRERG
ncbi:MAG: DNA primase [Proteobacteria bacterium]|nr:DNA primase [Pseudomonadota bacterium]